jgi:phosphoribosylglycinamide formyltransferase-1
MKLAVLISGRGTNLQALIDACAVPDYPAEIAVVVSNVPGAAGLDRAAAAGSATRVVDHRDYAGRPAFEDALHAVLAECGAELICLAGFMRLLTAGFVDRWHDRLINIHPSLLPSYKGLDTHARVLADGVPLTGCTVHFVRPDMDAGPIIVQAAVAVHPGDDADSLARRVLAAEHRCFPLAVRLIAEGRVTVTGERVAIRDAAAPENALINPIFEQTASSGASESG